MDFLLKRIYWNFEEEDFEEMSNDEWRSCLFQIIMTLVVYQKCFDFTHNDLHTNNIMYVKTEKQHIYVKYDIYIYMIYNIYILYL